LGEQGKPFFESPQEKTLGTTLPKDIKADKTLDCLGLFCPEPVYRTRLELDKIEGGQTLEVWADDPAAEKDIPSLAKRLGHEILATKKEGSKLYFLIKKRR
jgi:tRNA 2-thiouridine synthesizing protein A